MRVFPQGVLALDVKFLCRSCQNKLRIDARWEGRDITCPECKQTTAVPRWSRRAPIAVSISAAEVEFLTGSIKTDGQPGTA